MITKQGREIAKELTQAGAAWESEGAHNVLNSISLICRHAKTYRRLVEIQCGDGIHSGEWVNEHYDYLVKREAQLAARFAVLAKDLPVNVCLRLDGDPRGLVVRLLVTDSWGVLRTVGID